MGNTVSRDRQKEEKTDVGQEELTKEAKVDSHSDRCVICLDAISERAVASPCRHESFDFQCLLTWMQENPTCPLCKAEVNSVQYQFRSRYDFSVYEVKSRANHTSSTHLGQRSDGSKPRAASMSRRRPRVRPTQHLSPAPGVALRRRRQVYRSGMYSLHIGSNRLSRFRDLTVELFCRDEELISRARKWIRRELQVFEYLNQASSGEEGTSKMSKNPEFLLEYIIAILKSVDIKGSSGEAEDMLQEFLGRDDARLFLHELKAWLRSPYTTLEDWDRHVQYRETPLYIPEDDQFQSATRSYSVQADAISISSASVRRSQRLLERSDNPSSKRRRLETLYD